MAIDSSVYDTVKEAIKTAERILICVNGSSSYDCHSAALSLNNYLQDLEKNVVLTSGENLSARCRKLYESFGVQPQNALGPLNYVITINHRGAEVEKVGYDDKDGKFFLYITPRKGSKKFDFENVSYSYGGNEFDLIFVVGARSLKWIGNIYEKNQEIFEDSKIVNVNNDEGAQEFGSYRLVDHEIPVSEIIFKLMNGNSTASVDKIFSLLSRGIIDHLQLMQGTEFKISTIETLTSLIKHGVDLKACIKDLYLSKDLSNFGVVKSVFSNMNFDENSGLAWSGVSSLDLNRLGINRDNLILGGKIAFNISRDIKYAFVMYEIESDEVWVEFESNNEDFGAKDLMSDYNPEGNKYRVVFVVKGKSLSEVEEEILSTLKQKLGVTEFVPSIEGGGLTEAPKEVHNGAISEEETEEEPEKTDEETVEETEDTDGAGLVMPPPITPSS